MAADSLRVRVALQLFSHGKFRQLVVRGRRERRLAHLENKLDVGVPLGWKLFDQELHTGGFFSRTELFGNAAEGLNENHIYTVNGGS